MQETCVWVDADSCPREVRKFLLRAATRLNRDEASVPFHFVAAKDLLYDDPQNGISCTSVTPGQDASDHFILENCGGGDIVITRDIVFAEQICQRGVCVLNDRGVEYTTENVSARRRQRDLKLELRQIGALPLSPSKNNYGAKDLEQFANGFDRCLTRKLRIS